MALSTAQNKNFKRGAHPALGSKLGIIENTIDVSEVTNGDGLTAITFASATLIIAAGIEIKTATNASVTVDLGDSENGTEYVSAQDGTDTAGTQMARVAVTPIMKAAASVLVLSIGGATPSAGSMRVWAIVADPGGASG